MSFILIDETSEYNEKSILDIDMRRLVQPQLELNNPILKCTGILVQLLSVANIAQPSGKQYVAGLYPQVLQIRIADGTNKYTGIVLQSNIPKLSLGTAPGSKLSLCGDIRVVNGKLLLDHRNVSVLGGKVPSLLAAWRANMELKAKKRDNHADNEDPPPPFVEFIQKENRASNAGQGHTADKDMHFPKTKNVANPQQKAKLASKVNGDRDLKGPRGKSKPLGKKDKSNTNTGKHGKPKSSRKADTSGNDKSSRKADTSGKDKSSRKVDKPGKNKPSSKADTSGKDKIDVEKAKQSVKHDPNLKSKQFPLTKSNENNFGDKSTQSKATKAGNAKNAKHTIKKGSNPENTQSSSQSKKGKQGKINNKKHTASKSGIHAQCDPPAPPHSSGFRPDAAPFIPKYT